jgi:hypothetical protein
MGEFGDGSLMLSIGFDQSPLEWIEEQKEPNSW